ncbi:MAG TPA: hypothetical protein VJ578_00755 [Dehalococcoidia bacterium]|nr:hypothetical protein [Dehalococcoidia bacterium]
MIKRQDLYPQLLKIADDYPWLHGDPLLLIAAAGQVRWLPSTFRCAGDAILLTVTHAMWEETTPETLRELITLVLHDAQEKGLVP